jgi:hypothetical protein
VESPPGKVPVESPDQVPVESPDQVRGEPGRDHVRGEPGRGTRTRRPYLVEVGWRRTTDPDSPHVPPAATEPEVRISLGTAIKIDYFRPGMRSIFGHNRPGLSTCYRPQMSPGFESRRVLTP